MHPYHQMKVSPVWEPLSKIEIKWLIDKPGVISLPAVVQSINFKSKLVFHLITC